MSLYNIMNGVNHQHFSKKQEDYTKLSQVFALVFAFVSMAHAISRLVF